MLRSYEVAVAGLAPWVVCMPRVAALGAAARRLRLVLAMSHRHATQTNAERR